MPAEILKQQISRLALILFLLTFCIAAAVQGQSQSLNNLVPVQDTYVSQNNGNSNFGSNSFGWLGDIAGANALYLQYNLSSIPPNSTIVSATLSFQKRTTDHSGDMVVQLRKRRASWSSSTVTWNGSGPLQDPIFGSGSLNTSLSFPVLSGDALKAMVTDWVQDPSSNHGITILPGVPDGTSISFYMKENTLGGNPIRLSVTYQPCSVPGTFSLNSPANGQQFPANTLSTTLSWGTSFGATSYDVYFGTSTNPPFLQNVTTTSRGVGVDPGQTYYWRVVAKNSCGTTASSSGTRSFSVDCAKPGVPSGPVPQDGTTLGTQPSILDWTDASGADSYEVFLNGNSIGTTSSSQISLPVSLQPGEHIWQVRARSSCGITDGPLWRFTIADRGTLQARVLDQNGVPKGNASCRLYDANGQYLGSTYDRITGPDGVAPAWTNLPVGRYIVKAFFAGPSPFPGEELWASAAKDVVGAATTAVDLLRNLSYASGYEIRHESSTGALLGPELEAGVESSLWIGVRARQESGAPQSSRVTVIFDKDRLAPWDLKLDLPFQTLGSGTTAVFPEEFSLGLKGSYSLALQVESQEGGQWVKTDGWNWINAVTVWPTTIDFSGHRWRLSLGDGGPRDALSLWSRNPRNVWEDAQGLHLRLEKRNDIWYGPELELTENLGYGEYVFQIDGNVDSMDHHAVLALFVIEPQDRDPRREIDIEITRFGESSRQNGNYILHPKSTDQCSDSSPVFRCFDVPDGASTHSFVWNESSVEFHSAPGLVDDPRSVPAIGSATLIGDPAHGVARPERAPTLISFWVYQATGDTSEPPGDSIEVTIKKFIFRGPRISTSKASLAPAVLAGTSGPIDSFEVWNGGYGILDYTITAQPAWLSVDVQAGTSRGERDPINVSVDSSGLTPGSYTGTITISAGPKVDPVTIPVDLTVTQGPAIAVTPDSMDFDEVPVGSTVTQTFTVRNAGGGILEGQAQTFPPFVIASGSFYTLGPGESASIAVTFSPIVGQDYGDIVTFSGGGGATRIVRGEGVDLPDSPGPLQASPISETQIALLWSDNSDNEDGFRIERREGEAGPWSLITIRPAGSMSYEDSSLVCGTEYFYRIRAFNVAGESAPSNEAGATPECSCAQSIFPETQSFDALGGTGSFNVTACGPWTAVSDAGWLTVTSGASGSGNGTVGFRVDRSNVQSARTGSISLPELGLTFTVQQAAAPADPGFTSFLRLVSGTVAGQAVDPDHRTVTVQAGSAISGSLTLQIDSSFSSNAVMAIGITPSWGDHATSYTDLGHFSTPASGLLRNATIAYTAPSTPGTYHVIAAYRGEFNAGQVMSATNWGVGTLVWNNGDDIAGWSQNLIDTANRDGNVLADYLYNVNIPTWVPATAITIVVEAPTPQPPAAPTWLRTTPSSPTSIDLLWDDNANNEDGFKVERKEGPAGPWTIIVTLPANATTYQDTGLTCGTTYAYRVWAFNAAGDSGATNEAGATPECPCNESLTPESASFDAVGGAGSFTVTACDPWTAVSDTGWITVTSGTSGSGNGSVSFRVDRSNVQSARTGSISLPELGLTFMVQQAAAPADPGFTSFLRLVSGTVAGQTVDPDHRAVTVQPGAVITGSLTLQIDSSFPSNAVMAIGITPSWGDRATSYTDLGHFSTPASGLLRDATINSTAPSTPGTYHVIAAYRGEFNAGQVMSATNWGVGTLVWNNGDDIAGWSQNLIETANRDGNVLADYLYNVNIQTWVPATAITIVVEAPAPQPPASPSWLRTTPASPTSIDLLWDDNANNEDGFKIERKVGLAGPWTIIATLPASATTYQDTGLTCGTTYAYRVWAFNSGGDSGTTNEAGATPECAPQSAVLLSDDFEDGASAGWQSWVSGWSESGGAYHGTETGADLRNETVWSGGSDWSDYIAEVDLALLGTYGPADGQLLLRYNSETDRIACRLFQYGSSRELQLLTPGQPMLSVPFGYITGQAYRLRASAVQDSATCEVVGHPATRLVQASLGSRTGTVGLRNTHVAVSFDNLEVRGEGERMFSDGFESGDLAGWTSHTGSVTIRPGLVGAGGHPKINEGGVVCLTEGCPSRPGPGSPGCGPEGCPPALSRGR